jgi:hypothetical protein
MNRMNTLNRIEYIGTTPVKPIVSYLHHEIIKQFTYDSPIQITEEKLTINILLALKKELDQQKEFQPKQILTWVSRTKLLKCLA